MAIGGTTRAEPKCIFGCGQEGVINMSDARHVGLGFACLACIIRAARKKHVERLIREERKRKGVDNGHNTSKD